MEKPPSNRAKFTINCVLLYWRHLPARLPYNVFGWSRSCFFLFVTKTTVPLNQAFSIHGISKWGIKKPYSV